MPFGDPPIVGPGWLWFVFAAQGTRVVVQTPKRELYMFFETPVEAEQLVALVAQATGMTTTVAVTRRKEAIEVAQAGREELGGVGVSAAFLREFAAEMAIKLGPTATTREICTKGIVTVTHVQRCAYANLLEGRQDPETGRPYLGEPTVFISHAWDCLFSALISVMLDHATENPKAYFWCDIFANDQNEDAIFRQRDSWSSAFQRSILSIGQVIVVLSPWNDPLPLGRAWCLFEIMTCLQARGAQLLIKLPPQEEGDFHDALLRCFRDTMDALMRVNTEDSGASVDDDIRMIFNAIRSTIGFDRLNELVRSHLREWLLEEGLKAAQRHEIVDAEGDDLEFASLCSYLAGMLIRAGNHDRALHYHSKALTIRMQTLGEEHLDTGDTYSQMANVHNRRGTYDSALECYSKALSIRRKSLGEDHPSIGATYNNMAAVYERRGESAHALAYYRQALSIKLRALGAEHPKLASTYNNMAVVYKNRGEYAHALEYFGKALSIQMNSLGENHPDTGGTCFNIANVYKRQGKRLEAKKYFARAQEAYSNVYGPDHSETQAVTRRIAAL